MIFSTLKDAPVVFIGICGAAGAGKDMVARGIDMCLNKTGITSVTMSLAEPIKELASRVFPVQDCYLFYDRKAKEMDLDVLAGQSPRKVLQELGGGARELIHQHVWIKALENRVLKQVHMLGCHEALPDLPINVIVPDIRYRNEVEWLKQERKGTLVKVVRPSLKDKVREHESEANWERFEADFTYNNEVEFDGSMDAIKRVAEWWEGESA